MFAIFDLVLNRTVVVAVVYIAFTFYYVFSYKVFFGRSWGRSMLDVLVQYILSSTIYFILLNGILLGAYALTK